MKKTHSFTYQAHYAISKEPSGKEKMILICFHGYGQLVEFFIRKFLPFATEEVLILAPEGTNYQYLQDFKGRIGANWMTRHERELAIHNNHNYLNSLLSEILGTFEKKPKVALLGFSQGAATATRWMSQWTEEVDFLILWAGVFAHDMKPQESQKKLDKTKIYAVHGTEDELITEEILEKQREFLRKLGKTAQEYQFSGGHEIQTEILKKVMADLI
ncbi:alpha/beta hydrolase [Algoriphagus namhaensis]